MTSIPAIDEYGPNDREALSALFDGELDGDAARFALKRLRAMPPASPSSA